MRADRTRGQAAQLAEAQDRGFDLVVAHGAGVMRVDIQRQRLRHADGIGDLDSAARGQACGNHVLGQVPGDVGGGPVHLGRVLAAERTAAVRGRTAIGVDDDLAPGQARVTVRPADLEATGGVDVVFGLAQQHGRDHVGHHPLHIGVQLGLLLALVITRRMLGGDDHGSCSHRQAAFVLQGHLAFRIRLQERGRAAVAVSRHALQYLVAVIEGGRHQVGRLVGGIAEHDALVARAFILVGTRVHPLRDVGRLAVQAIDELEILPVETVLLVADFPDRLAHHTLDLVLGAGGPFTVLVDTLAADFACQHHQLGGGQRFAGDARFRVLRQEQVDNGIGNLVRNLVRVAFGNAFGREQIGFAHGSVPVLGRLWPITTQAGLSGLSPHGNHGQQQK